MKKKEKKFFRRYINGTQGVISLFLAILMVPFVAIAGVLITAGRLNSAVSLFDEALCNASNSTLGTYDKFLRKRFGLMALSQDASDGGAKYGHTTGSYTADDFLNDVFTYYMQQNLEIVSKTYEKAEYEADGLYPLADPTVLLNSIKSTGNIVVPAKLAIDWLSLDDMINSFTKGFSLFGTFSSVGSSAFNTVTDIDSIKDDKKALEKALKELEKAEEKYDKAFDKFDESVDKYNDDTSKTSDLEDKSDDYYETIVEVRNKLEAVGEAAVKLQKDCSTLQSDIVSTGTNIVKAGTESTIASNEKQIKDYQSQKESALYQSELAEKAGDTRTSTNYYQEAQECDQAIRNLEEANLKLKNGSTVGSSAVDAGSGAYKDIANFANKDLTSEYQDMYTKLETLRKKIGGYPPSDGSTIDTSDCYVVIRYPVSSDSLKEFEKNLEKSVVENSAWGMVKAVFSFLKALLSLAKGITYDHDLVANINTGHFSNGLPSGLSKDSDLLSSPYEMQDAAVSVMLNMSMDMHESSAALGEANAVSAFEALSGYVDDLLDVLDGFKPLEDAGDLADAVKGIFGVFTSNNLSDVLAAGWETLMERLMVVGYISYNTANRTTYTGTSLTGAKFSLPIKGQDQGYVFNGAETEYIYHGSLSEQSNQQSVYNGLLIQRMLLNIGVVIGDSLVQSLASAAAAVPIIGPILYLLVFVLVDLVESFLDLLILCNGGSVSMAKSYLFLSAAGIPKLVEKLLSVGLSKEAKQKIYNGSRTCFDAITPEDTSAGKTQIEFHSFTEEIEKQTYREPKDRGFEYDYTKALQIMLLLFRSTDKLVRRFADIIQMEASYNAATGGIATYGFDLTKSYTCVRAAGNFTTSEFMPSVLKEDGKLTSTNRVIYRSY